MHLPRMIHGAIVGALLLLLLLPGCDRDGRKPPAPEEHTGAPLVAPGVRPRMPEFSLPSAYDGKLVSSTSWRGRVRLVVFFTPWCSSCSAHMAMLQDLLSDYDPTVFSVIAIAIIEPKEVQELEQFIDRLDLEFPILVGNAVVKDAFGGIIAIPTTFLVDPHGNIVKKEITHLEQKDLAAQIDALMRQRPDSQQ